MNRTFLVLATASAAVAATLIPVAADAATPSYRVVADQAECGPGTAMSEGVTLTDNTGKVNVFTIITRLVYKSSDDQQWYYAPSDKGYIHVTAHRNVTPKVGRHVYAGYDWPADDAYYQYLQKYDHAVRIGVWTQERFSVPDGSGGEKIVAYRRKWAADCSLPGSSSKPATASTVIHAAPAGASSVQAPRPVARG